jgi:hypothetical protein
MLEFIFNFKTSHHNQYNILKQGAPCAYTWEGINGKSSEKRMTGAAAGVGPRFA